MDIADIARMLGDRIDELVPAILPNAERGGHEWWIGSVAGERGRSMAIHRSGGKRGVWKDFSDSTKGGDALDLVAAVCFAGNKKDAVKYARGFLGIDRMDPAQLKQTRAQVRQQAKKADDEARAKAESRRKFAQKLWLGAQADLQGTPVDLYLLGRGISLSSLAKPPGAIRYAPSLKHPNGNFYPAMIAQICGPGGQFMGAHRTYLHRPAPDVVTKAPLGKDAKLTLGSWRGGYIPLARGASGKALASAPEGDRVILCEGIEDGLTLAMCCPDWRVLAAVNVGNIQNLKLPRTIGEVLIAADNDAPGSAAAKAVEAAVRRFYDEGRTVRVAHAQSGKDFNDWLRGAAEARRA